MPTARPLTKECTYQWGAAPGGLASDRWWRIWLSVWKIKHENHHYCWSKKQMFRKTRKGKEGTGQTSKVCLPAYSSHLHTKHTQHTHNSHLRAQHTQFTPAHSAHTVHACKHSSHLHTQHAQFTPAHTAHKIHTYMHSTHSSHLNTNTANSFAILLLSSRCSEHIFL